MVRLSDFAYELPEELIAQTPLADRAGSRLLHLDRVTGEVTHCAFRDAGQFLRAGDVLVLNNTRVNAWRFIAHRSTGAEIEILALREVEAGVFECLAKPAKRLKVGEAVAVAEGLTATLVGAGEEAIRLVRFESETADLHRHMAEVGHVPLPPYITTALEDKERYQTVVASQPGSAAAPTAGLHFTPEVLAGLREKGVEIAEITLHVGIDTFRPVQVDDVTDHKMHGEVCEIRPDVAERINARKGRLIAVGTTAVRTLETFATGEGMVGSGQLESKLFIRPGYEFKAVDGMFTNFHLPKTTMLLMISAMAGRENVLAAYAQAVAERYRFLSFGDSMLIL